MADHSRQWCIIPASPSDPNYVLVDAAAVRSAGGSWNLCEESVQGTVTAGSTYDATTAVPAGGAIEPIQDSHVVEEPDFDNRLSKEIQRHGLSGDNCQSLFAVLRQWHSLEWCQVESYIVYVASDPRCALQRMTRVHKILHTLLDQGYLTKSASPRCAPKVPDCKICGGTGCNWCNKKRCTLPASAPGNPMNKEWIIKWYEERFYPRTRGEVFVRL